MEAYIYNELQKREAEDWWFVGRRKIVLALLNRYLPKKRNLSIADVGCGAGDVMELLKPFGRVLGIDSDKRIVEFNKSQGRNVIQGKINKLGFPERSFDLVSLLEVLEHLDDDRRALREIFRVLKRRGWLVVTVPAFNFLWGSHDLAAHHKRRYTGKELKERLESQGFQVMKMSYMNIFLFPPIFLIRYLKTFFKIGKDKSDFFEYPYIINKLLEKVFSFEARFIDKLNFPAGVSIIAIARKP